MKKILVRFKMIFWTIPLLTLGVISLTMFRMLIVIPCKNLLNFLIEFICCPLDEFIDFARFAKWFKHVLETGEYCEPYEVIRNKGDNE